MNIVDTNKEYKTTNTLVYSCQYHIIFTTKYRRQVLTDVIQNRLKEHNKGEVVATRNKGPWVLRFYKKYNTIKEARQIEYKLKKLKNKKILERIIKNQEIKITV